MTWTEYAEHLEASLVDLHARVHTGAYSSCCRRAGSTYRRRDGRQRPLGIAAIEDKIVQAAVVAILDGRSMRRSSWDSATGSDRSAISTKRWMRSRSGSGSGGSTGCSIVTFNPFSTRSAGIG